MAFSVTISIFLYALILCYSFTGEYHHHDLFVYPIVADVDQILRSETYEVEKGFFGFVFKNMQDHFAAFSEAMATRCLPFYLKPYKSLLLNDGEYPRVDEFVQDVQHTYSMHEVQCVQDCGERSPVLIKLQSIQKVNMLVLAHCTFYDILNSVFAQQEFKRWLEGIVTELFHVESLRRQFISSVVIACCIKECKLDVRQLKLTEFVCPLLQMLHIQPSVGCNCCSNVSYLLDITTDKFR